MKKFLLIVLSLSLVTAVYSQDQEDEQDKVKVGKMEQSDRVVVDVFTDLWQNLPADSIMKPNGFTRGANVYVMSDLPLGTSNFSFATGLGIGCHNLYTDARPYREMQLDTAGTPYFTGKTSFTKIPSQLSDGTEIKYKVNKIAVVYADVPIEFRYRTKNKKFKMAIGGKIGLMLSNNNKYVGDDYTNTLDPKLQIKEKDYKIRNIQAYRYALHLRVGWKWLNAYASYSLAPLFKKDKGPDMYPISVGLSFTPL